MKANKKGVVNQGFTVEFSSEDDDSLSESKGSAACTPVNRMGDSKNATAAPEHSVSMTTGGKPANQENFSGHLAFVTDKGQPLHSNNLTPQGKSTLQNNAENRGRSHSIASYTPPEKNARTGSMVSANVALVETAYATFPNGNANGLSHITTEIKKSNGEIGYLNNIQKEYYRDVRLSLDVGNEKKQITPEPKQFHRCSINSNSKQDYGTNTNCSAYRTEDDQHEYDLEGESVLGGEQSECESCQRRILDNYKIVFKYVLERPLFCFCLWSLFYIYFSDDALIGGSFFALTILEITALFLGYVAELLCLPGLLGMLAAGIILKNVKYIDFANDLDPTVSSSLRGISVVILLVRGALGVNPVNIMKYTSVIPPLVIGSCALEALAATISVYYFIGFPLEWAALMGCIMSALSGIAVVPYLGPTEKYLSLKADPCTVSPNYQKVLAIARTSCGLDAMIAICMAEVALGFIFAEGDVGAGFFKGIVEILIGGAFGILWGFLAGNLLDEKSSHEKRVTTVFCCGVMSLIGLTKIGYPRGGPLATFLGVLLTSTIWKKKQIGGNNNEKLSATFTLSWYFFQPLLFSIIGTRTDFEIIDWDVVTKGLICLVISLSVRFISSFLMTSWGNLTIKERIYLSIAWLPKGTVQAALGPVALDTVLSSTGLSSPLVYKALAIKVMNISAFTVLAAAIFGCLCLKLIGPRLLSSRK